MTLAIRHFPDRKRPCIVLEEGNKAVVLGYLTDRTRESWLRKAFNVSGTESVAINCGNLYRLDEIMKEGDGE